MAENVSLFIQAQRGIYLVVMIVLALLFFACLVRAVRGPRVADRLVAVNMVGTMVMVMIAVLSMYLGEEYLLDICLIYAMVSFLAVIVLTKVYIGIYEEQHLESGDAGEGHLARTEAAGDTIAAVESPVMAEQDTGSIQKKEVGV